MIVEEFDRFVNLPENADKTFEYIGGEVVEVPSAPYASELASNVLFSIGEFIRPRQLGHITGENCGYAVYGERYVPNVAFTVGRDQRERPRIGYVPCAPDLAVEIISPADALQQIHTKIANYLAAGTLLWLVLPETHEVEIYAPGQPMKRVGLDGILEGGEVLPGFTLAVKDIFPV